MVNTCTSTLDTVTISASDGTGTDVSVNSVRLIYPTLATTSGSNTTIYFTGCESVGVGNLG